MTNSKVFVDLTYQCDNKCLFCCIENEDYFIEGREAPFLEIQEKLIGAFKENDLVVLSGGEPLLHREIEKIIELATSLYSGVSIISHGRQLADEAFLKKILKKVNENCNLEFYISLHGGDSGVHDFLVQTDGAYRETLSGIKNLIKHKQKVRTNTVVTRQNHRTLYSASKTLLEVGVTQVDFSLMAPLGGGLNRFLELCPDISKTSREIEDAIQDFPEISFTMDGFPLCVFSKKNHDHLNKGCSSANETCDSNCLMLRKDNGFCEGCTLRGQCLGVNKYYLQAYGSSEFKPIKDTL